MIEHEMLFLGLLMDGPKHGYEIKRKIAAEIFPLVGLKIKSIYYPLQRMEILGYVEKDVGREGRFPEKFIYQITPKGKKRFQQLVEASFLTIERPFFSIDLAVYFMPHIEKNIARRKLKARLRFLQRIQQQLKKWTQKDFTVANHHLQIILEHDLDLVDAEIHSLNRLIHALL